MADLKSLEQVNIDEVLRRELQGASFAEVETEIRSTLDVLLPIFRVGPPKVPNPIFNVANREANDYLNTCNRARALDMNNPQYQQVRQGILSTFRKIWDEIGPYAGFALVLQEQELRRLGPEARSLLDETRATSKQAEAAAREAQEAAKAAKESAYITAVSELSAAYQGEADNCRKRARRFATMGLGVALGTGVLLFGYTLESASGMYAALPATLIRITTIGVLYGTFHLCLRTYQAYSHLEIVNRHRVNIGRTFEVLKAAQPSEGAKDVFAALASSHLLAFGKSGLLARDLSVQSPLSGADELLKSVWGNRETKP